MAKPFSIQAPEDIAKEYAGNKQMIAQAAQMGVVDPTAAVLAGMFIDRMRSAQVMEAAQQPTVAQQVLGGGGAPAPLAANPAASAGMGALPPMPPPSSMPPQEMPQPEMAMAAGGLTTLPVPDAMFDEPTNGGFNDGYAGGGMVAFAGGGDVDLERFRKAIIAQESGGDYGVMNAEGSGAMGAYQFMPPTARALAERLGLPYRPELLQGKGGRTKEGRAYQDALGTAQLQDALKFGGGDVGKAGAYHFAGPNKAGHGPKTRKYEQDILRRYSGSKEGSDMFPERDIGTAEGRASSREDIFQSLQSRFGSTPEEQAVEDKRMARAEEMASPEYYEKQRKADMWETLTEIGVNMASKPIAEAIGAAMPGARAAKKERAALKDRALDAMGEINGLKRKENLQLFGMAVELSKEGVQQEQFERKLASEETQSNLDRAAQLEGYKISAAGKTTDLESATQVIYESLVKSNAQGLLTKDGKPFTFAPEALKRQALVAAAKLVKPPKPATDLSGALQLDGTSGTGTGGSTVVDYGALEQ